VDALREVYGLSKRELKAFEHDWKLIT